MSASAAIECAEPEFDFGTKYSTELVNHTFILKNTGDSTTDIIDVKPNCGCVVVEPSARTLAPGEQTKIVLEMSLAERDGPQKKRILVITNDPDEPRLNLHIKGISIDLISISPSMLIAFRLKKEQIERRFTVSSQAPGPFEIQIKDTENPRLKADVLPGNSDQEKIILVTIDTKSDQTPLNGNILITTNVEKRPIVKLPYRISCSDVPFKLPSRVPQSPDVVPSPQPIPPLPSPETEAAPTPTQLLPPPNVN